MRRPSATTRLAVPPSTSVTTRYRGPPPMPGPRSVTSARRSRAWRRRPGPTGSGQVSEEEAVGLGGRGGVQVNEEPGLAVDAPAVAAEAAVGAEYAVAWDDDGHVVAGAGDAGGLGAQRVGGRVGQVG